MIRETSHRRREPMRAIVPAAIVAVLLLLPSSSSAVAISFPHQWRYSSQEVAEQPSEVAVHNGEPSSIAQRKQRDLLVDANDGSSRRCRSPGDLVLDPFTDPQVAAPAPVLPAAGGPICADFNGDGTDGFGPCPGYYSHAEVRSSSDLPPYQPFDDDPPSSRNLLPSFDPYLHLRDTVGPSLVCGSTPGLPLLGDWTEVADLGCSELCFRMSVFSDGCEPGVEGCPRDGNSPIDPKIILQGGPPNYYRAVFAANAAITDGNGNDPGWHEFCVPISPLDADGNLPSGEDGGWSMSNYPCNYMSGSECTSGTVAPNSTWMELLLDVHVIALPIDYVVQDYAHSYLAERFGYDDICLIPRGCPEPTEPKCEPWVLTRWKYEWDCRGWKKSMETLIDYLEDAETFGGGISVCKVLNEKCAPDVCDMAEQEFLAVLLNLASGKVEESCCVASPCIPPNSSFESSRRQRFVSDVIAEVDELLKDPRRTNYDCITAMWLASGVNDGAALGCDDDPIDPGPPMKTTTTTTTTVSYGDTSTATAMTTTTMTTTTGEVGSTSSTMSSGTTTRTESSSTSTTPASTTTAATAASTSSTTTTRTSGTPSTGTTTTSATPATTSSTATDTTATTAASSAAPATTSSTTTDTSSTTTSSATPATTTSSSTSTTTAPTSTSSTTTTATKTSTSTTLAAPATTMSSTTTDMSTGTTSSAASTTTKTTSTMTDTSSTTTTSAAPTRTRSTTTDTSTSTTSAASTSTTSSTPATTTSTTTTASTEASSISSSTSTSAAPATTTSTTSTTGATTSAAIPAVTTTTRTTAVPTTSMSTTSSTSATSTTSSPSTTTGSSTASTTTSKGKCECDYSNCPVDSTIATLRADRGDDHVMCRSFSASSDGTTHTAWADWNSGGYYVCVGTACDTDDRMPRCIWTDVVNGGEMSGGEVMNRVVSREIVDVCVRCVVEYCRSIGQLR